MHIHILGICGTFMGGIASLAIELGHKVTGSDTNVYPPMSTQLESLGIEISQLDDLSQFEPEPDLVVIGNALSRGHACVEYVLDKNLPYTSGPEWLRESVLRKRWVLAVSGTHGKTTTTSMLAWILDYAGYQPGFLIGGVAENFNASARLGDSSFFVIEADEYDSAFFDKRAKCVHYLPNTFVINNLEFDHADIYANLAAIQTQIHHTVRCVPQSGGIIANADDKAVVETLEKGCWSEVRWLNRDWHLTLDKQDGSAFSIAFRNDSPQRINWSLFGMHNVHNAAMAIAAAHHVGVTTDVAAEALASFENVKRRMEHRGRVNDIDVYDDFAHHPTAIRTTLEGAKARFSAGRLFAIIEPRSNTMKMGFHKDTLNDSWTSADKVWLKTTPEMNWIDTNTVSNSQTAVCCMQTTDEIIADVVRAARPGDHIVIMSNGGFDNIHSRLLEALNG